MSLGYGSEAETASLPQTGSPAWLHPALAGQRWDLTSAGTGYCREAREVPPQLPQAPFPPAVAGVARPGLSTSPELIAGMNDFGLSSGSMGPEVLAALRASGQWWPPAGPLGCGRRCLAFPTAIPAASQPPRLPSPEPRAVPWTGSALPGAAPALLRGPSLPPHTEAAADAGGTKGSATRAPVSKVLWLIILSRGNERRENKQQHIN